MFQYSCEHGPGAFHYSVDTADAGTVVSERASGRALCHGENSFKVEVGRLGSVSSSCFGLSPLTVCLGNVTASTVSF